MARAELTGEKVNQKLYFPIDMIREIELEALRLDRSFSKMVIMAWRIARAEIGCFPSIDDVRLAARLRAAPPSPAEGSPLLRRVGSTEGRSLGRS